MASTVTQFPPTTYSSSYFLRNVIKEDKRKQADGVSRASVPLLGSVVATFLSKRLSNGSAEKKTDATAAICEDTAVLEVDFACVQDFCWIS
ncbi:hypothetical protein L798_05589 [Zootermopsis nevadensis]|uniref:Uncharacterized protein n=1 Tax=Zootermopsis nevadensis TaxID=136037 RepID=A0A067QS69_ZOONE|nr:hypothetical protein L798_05589 [Zootermopsis nevadensis]